jgi:hypothetical protein
MNMETDFVVFSVEDGNFEMVQRGLDSTADARKWIKEHGCDGCLFQVAQLKGGVVRVEAETYRRATLEKIEDSD